MLQLHGQVNALDREKPEVVSAIDDYLQQIGGRRVSGIDNFGYFDFILPKKASAQVFDMVNHVNHVKQIDAGHISFAPKI